MLVLPYLCGGNPPKKTSEGTFLHFWRCRAQTHTISFFKKNDFVFDTKEGRKYLKKQSNFFCRWLSWLKSISFENFLRNFCFKLKVQVFEMNHDEYLSFSKIYLKKGCISPFSEMCGCFTLLKKNPVNK